MNTRISTDLYRREFLLRTSAVTMASMLAGYAELALAEPPPETRKIRLIHAPALCLAPQYIAEELLRLEGFTDVNYYPVGTRIAPQALGDGRVDVTMWNTPGLIPYIDLGLPLVLLAGVHSGCYELFGNDRVNAIRDCKGKTLATYHLGSGDHYMFSSILAYVGIDPQKDVKWITSESTGQDAMALFADGKADAFFGFSPQPQELRAKKIGHVLIDTSVDKPWSQYFCCTVAANRDFVGKNPIATKRALRAILKASDICANEPERAARFLFERGYERRLTIGLEVMKTLRYDRWREYDPTDTLRYFALRLYEVGMIKTSPEKFIAQAADWRFLNELKRELKA
ncbi:MAG: ABC transporter substrate-binding protein [Burkholderiales bacterium]